MESRQDVFHPSPGVFRFPLVRQEDASFFEIFFVCPAPRGWYQEFEFSNSDSDDFSDPEDFDVVWREDIFNLMIEKNFFLLWCENFVLGGGIFIKESNCGCLCFFCFVSFYV